ncbi:MAG: 2,3-bisphosphoglycerate-dependent phosphoglycerate mutase [bacterium]|nr:2,3-bisphosphoglycerate-dependent phosphoglycerate mutase [bacterium]
MPTLVLVRHGVSTWNLENRFTGWVDVPLAPAGETEAREAGRHLRRLGMTYDIAFTSALQRARRTLEIMLEEMSASIPIHALPDLNERHYGELQGLLKSDMVARYGAEQVHRWRRSYAERPPGGESLADTAVRVLRCYHHDIVPALRAHPTTIVVAHGNTIRGLVMHLETISPEDIPNREIPFGVPIVYELDDALTIISQST